SVFAMMIDAPAARAPAARSSVHRGAVEPATGTPGLYTKPAPSARLRAKCRWIHESSSGKPAAPAIIRSRARNIVSERAVASTTRRWWRRSAVTHGRVARIGNRTAVHRQRIEEAAVRQLGLDEPRRPGRRRRPVIHEPHEPAGARRQPDLAVGQSHHL